MGTIMGVKAPTVRQTIAGSVHGAVATDRCDFFFVTSMLAYFRCVQDEDPIMFHVLHEDGDGEDLELQEVQQGFALHDEMNGKGSKAGAAKTRAKRKAESSEDEDEEEQEEELTEEEEEEEEDEAEDDHSAPTSFLWPSLEARNRWQKVVEECTTTPALALAAMALRDHATAFGCCDAVEVTRSGRSTRKRGGRTSFTAARQQASEWSQEPGSEDDSSSDDDDDDDDDDDE